MFVSIIIVHVQHCHPVSCVIPLILGILLKIMHFRISLLILAIVEYIAERLAFEIRRHGT